MVYNDVGLMSYDVGFNFFLGYGTTHKVNDLILQGSFENTESRHKFSLPKKKRYRCPFLPFVSGTCLQCCQKKNVWPCFDFSKKWSKWIHLWWLLLKPGPGPWTCILKDLDLEKPGPWKTWTLKNLDPEKPGPLKT